jgi:carbon monoxide dehydrogenase subunit G
MRVNSSVIVRAPREQVWGKVTDPAAYLDFMSGVTRWELEGEVGDLAKRDVIELGSRIRMLMRVGSAELGGLIEIVECNGGKDLAWSSVTGVDQRGRWRLRDVGEGITRVELRFSYGVAGAGIGGMLAERVAAPIVRSRLRSSVQELKKITERDWRREQANRRREAAAA